MKSKLDTFTGHVAKEEQPHLIPDSWLWVEIGAISEIVAGGTPSTTKGNFFDGGNIPWITPADMSGFTEMYISEGRRNITEQGLKNSSARLLPKDSLLFSSRAPIGYVAIAKNPISTNQGFKSFLPSEAYLPHYGYWYLKSIKSLAESMASGTTFLELSGSKAAKIPFPLAPLNEQRRIVAHLNSAMQQVANTQERLEKLPILLKKFRRAVLAAAVSGTLTEAWRAKQTERGNAKELLNLIRAERRAQWEEKQLVKMTGKHLPKNDSWKKMYEEPTLPDTSELSELPEEWIYVSLEQLTNGGRPSSYGVLVPGSDFEGGIPMVRVGDINDGKVSVDNLKRIAPYIADEFKRTRLEGGELLITLVGSIGRTAIVPKELAGANTARAVGVIPLVEAIDKHWIEFYFRNPEKVIEMVTKSHEVARKTLNLDDVRRTAVVIPPLTEQKEIVHRVNHYFALADQIETRFEQASGLIEQVPYGLLAKAFSGQLVPQDPNDESVLDLLSKVRVAADNKSKEDANNARLKKAAELESSKKGRIMKAKPVKTLPEFIERLNELGGAVTPVQLLSESLLEDNIDTFFELLKEGRDQGKLNVPVGQSGLISLVEHEN